VLVVDLAPQAVSISAALGVDTNAPLAFTPADFLALPAAKPFAPWPVIPGKLDLVPGNQLQLAPLEGSLRRLFTLARTVVEPGTRARRATLDARLAAVEARYDFVLLDCPASLGEVTANALEAADLVLSPIDMKCRANVLSVTDLLQYVRALARAPVVMFVGNRWAPRQRQCRLALQDAQRLCGHRLFPVMVPECAAIAESLAEHRELRATSDLAARVAQATGRLGQAVIEFPGCLDHKRAAMAAVGGVP
jgi:cellulose biosynthesis protein BcsQ